MVGSPDDNEPSTAELEDLQAVMEQAGEDPDRIEQLLRMAMVDRDLYTDLVDLYGRQAAQNAVKSDPFPPYPTVDGRFRIGTNPDGEPVGLTPEEVNEHVLVVGRSGAGKTTLLYNLMDECIGQDVPFWAFDFKNDYRHLVPYRDLLVINWRDLKFNPLQPPPDVRPDQWGEIIVDTFAHTMDLLIGSEGYVLEKLRELYALYDTAGTGQYPSLFELQELAAADEIPLASPRFRYKERLVNRLSLMTGFSGEIFDCSEGYPLETLLERNVVFELKEPNQHVTNFVVEALLMWLFYYRDAHGQRQGLRHVVMFDEAKRVFDVTREQQPESGFPPIDALMGKVREFGEALVVADHEPSKLTDSVRANTNAKLWLSLGSGKDTKEMAQTFGLAPVETDFTRTLEKGDGLLKLADRDPVPLNLPDYALDKSMTTAEIRDRMQPDLEELPYTDRVRPEDYLLVVGDRPDTGEANDDSEDALGDVAEALLASVSTAPFLSLSDRYDALDVVARQGNEAKEELLTLGLVRETEVRTGKPGRNPKLLALTDAGRQALEERGYDVPGSGRRGIEHRYWQQQIKEHYEAQGFDTEIEFAIEQQRIDVYAIHGDETVAVEVARSPEHELANIVKCLEYDVDRVEVAYFDTSVRDRIEAAVRDEFGAIPARVAFVPISEYT